MIRIFIDFTGMYRQLKCPSISSAKNNRFIVLVCQFADIFMFDKKDFVKLSTLSLEGEGNQSVNLKRKYGLFR
jgi:hypothetical protein